MVQNIMEKEIDTAMNSDDNYKDLLTDISSEISRKPSKHPSLNPFRLTEDDPWIACVGSNGGTTDSYIFDGFADAVGAIYDSVKSYKFEEDAMVYPMAFCARHCIELGLKIGIKELLALYEMPKISNRVVVNRGDVNKHLLEHDIEELTNDLFALLPLDKRLGAYELDLGPIVKNYYFDDKGDAFRYAESRDNTPNLESRNVSHVGLTRLYESVMNARIVFDRLFNSLTLLYIEYKAGSYTTNLSRKDLEAISDRLPDRNLWLDESFDGIREELKAEFGISSNELSDAINIVQAVPVFSAKIGVEIKLGDIPDDELIAYKAVVRWYEDEVAVHPTSVNIGGKTLSSLPPLSNRHIKNRKQYDSVISDDTLIRLFAFYMLAHEENYCENYEEYYKHVRDCGLHRNHMLNKLQQTNVFRTVKVGMELCGQVSYLAVINVINDKL